METSITLSMQNIISILVPLCTLLGLGAAYYFKLNGRTEKSEQGVSHVTDDLKELGARVTESIQRLEDKVDQIIYSLALGAPKTIKKRVSPAKRIKTQSRK